MKYSLHPPLARLASAMDRLDARQALRQQRGTAQEMGIYESCVSALPDFSQAKSLWFLFEKRRREIGEGFIAGEWMFMVSWKKLMVIDGCW